MTALNLFKANSQKKELAAERARLDRSWKELAERESALAKRQQDEESRAERIAEGIATENDTNEHGRILDIPVDTIIPNPSQPRKQFDSEPIIRLADSIRRYGILQPLTVRRVEDGRCEIVAGERRLRAAKLLGLETVPCIIVDVDEKKSAELAIIENIQRENLNIFEQASSIASLIDIYNLTQEDAARQLSMSQSFVANKLRILRLTQPERDKILEYNLTERHARALLKVDSVEQRLRIIEYINSHSLNVATTEAYIDRMLAESGRKSNPRSPKRIILKDIRLFYNSLDKAVSLVRQAGIDIRTERTESDSNIDIVITIPKPPR